MAYLDGMADGSLIITLDEDTAARIKAAAAAVGESPGDFVLRAVASALDDDWAEDRRIADEYDRTGKFVLMDDALDRLDAKIAARRVKAG